MLSFMRLSVAVAVLAPALSAYASNILVLVGANNQLTFSPSNITANVGDTVTFQFQSKNHSVTQSSFASPCTPLVGGVDSGFQFVAADANALPQFSFTINNASKPLFFFSKQTAVVNECQKGMVFSINADPNSAKSFAAFQAAAEKSAAPSASAPFATASSGSEILVLVGQNNQLTFSPPNITANVGDTVIFQFESKNHSVTQSSFASPCTPLVGGVDSGFQFVAADANALPQFSFTINNASKPLFFFSKQTAAVNECQQGMVFSINADPNSADSFAAFQAAAENSAASSPSASSAAASSASAPSAPASSGSEILVLVGQNNQLTFSPTNVTANAGDTVTFQFQSKNHSVTQSSFASPCVPLAQGVDSGFQAVTINATAFPTFSFTLNNASTPLFFFSKQNILVNECQQGMVFSVNANPDSAKSFAAFQANAEASIAPSAKVNKKLQRKHPRDFASSAKGARK
ncbi:hypothetical protein K438DRAFT_1656883 [Mycena galopus ATCC 62051]|nr:hypothetical protein K438DRAFT_1656883 [Mycena galopus ATCC 62051]